MMDRWPFSQGTQRFDEIVAALNLLMEPGQVTELRALEATTSDRRYPGIVSGYFDRWDALAEAAVSHITAAKGIYIVPNVVDPALIARAQNRVRPVYKDPTTADHDIRRRRWLLVDCDPVRPAGISSTNTEHQQAIDAACEIAEALSAEHWPFPIIGNSGNGAHLMFRVDLPPDDGGLVECCLKGLAARFGTPAVHVDEKVYNPARIWKLPGTVAAKGDNTLERPHRLAKIIWVPDKLSCVPRELLDALAGQAPKDVHKPRRPVSPLTLPVKFDLASWIARHNLEVIGPIPWTNGQKWVFRICPWNEQHTNLSAYLIQLSNGAISAGCHHAGCAGKTWYDLRDLVEPNWRAGRKSDPAAVLPPQLPPAIQREYLRRSQPSRRRHL